MVYVFVVLLNFVFNIYLFVFLFVCLFVCLSVVVVVVVVVGWLVGLFVVGCWFVCCPPVVENTTLHHHRAFGHRGKKELERIKKSIFFFRVPRRCDWSPYCVTYPI